MVLTQRTAENPDAREFWQCFPEQLELLTLQILHLKGKPSDVAAGSREACDEPLAHRIGNRGHHDRDRARRPLCRPNRYRGAPHDDVHSQPNQLGCQLREPLGVYFRVSVLDDDVLPGHPAEIPEAPLERLALADRVGGWRIAWREHTDAGYLRTLCLGGERREEETEDDGNDRQPPLHHLDPRRSNFRACRS